MNRFSQMASAMEETMRVDVMVASSNFKRRFNKPICQSSNAFKFERTDNQRGRIIRKAVKFFIEKLSRN